MGVSQRKEKQRARTRKGEEKRSRERKKFADIVCISTQERQSARERMRERMSR